MADEIKWITVNGVHIPIKPGQSKEDAVKEFTDEQGRKKAEREKSDDELKRSATASDTDDHPNNRRTINKSEVTTDNKTYIFPIELSIKLGKNKLKFNKPIITTDVITIVKPDKLRNQAQVSKNYGGHFGKWCKKAGNAEVEISGALVKRQIHFLENSDGTIAEVKVKI